ncbi:MAG: ATP phosphoribosyltransferase regulatory subunit [Alphaproteobacteria bacterium]
MLNDEPDNEALLPAGLHDVLPPYAAQEAQVIAALMAGFAARGYEPVKPPLVEFETTLLADDETGLKEHMFRVMDPVSQRMMGIRADMTLQVARIAATRLRRAPRPLRLSYAGQVLRVRGSQLRPERQFTQAGVELIGTDLPSADIEVALLSVESLTRVGIVRPTLDLVSPTVVGAILDELGCDTGTANALRTALDHKDVGRLGELAGSERELFEALVRAAGRAETAVEALRRLSLPPAARVEVDRLDEVVAGIKAAEPDLSLTLDPVEYRGFKYHTGVSFTLFAHGVRGELGRGGRYMGLNGEPATGLSLFLDSILRALPPPPTAPRVFLPHGTSAAVAARVAADGWMTVAGLEPVDDEEAEARRLGCTHCLVDDAVTELPARGGRAGG